MFLNIKDNKCKHYFISSSSVGHGILICVMWKGILWQTHLGSTSQMRLHKFFPYRPSQSLYYTPFIFSRQCGGPGFGVSDLGSQAFPASFYLCDIWDDLLSLRPSISSSVKWESHLTEDPKNHILGGLPDLGKKGEDKCEDA